MVTPEVLKSAHVALETAGNVSGAARLLGMGEDRLKRIIEAYPELRSYLPNAEPPGEVETLARPALPAPSSDPDGSLVKAVQDGDEQLRHHFDQIGVRGDALEEAIAFRDFGKLHFEDMRHFIGGGVAKLYADLMADIKEVRRDIEGLSGEGGVMSEGDLAMQKILREDRSRLVDHVLKTYDRVREASLTASVIEAKRREARDGSKRKGKLSCPPLLFKVDGDVKVEPAKE